MEREAEPNPSAGPDTALPEPSAGFPEAAPFPPPAPLASASFGAAGPAASPAPASARAEELSPAGPPSILLLVVVTVVSLAADLVSKWWVKQHLYDPVAKEFRRLSVVKDHVDL